MPDEDGPLSHLVVVGSSAGGVQALSELVSTLPEDLPVPIVIAQHLDPERESNLQGILSKRSPLPVQTVARHEPLRPGVVYVVPADRHVNITDSEIDLQVDSAGRPKPSVDLLMSSAAEVFGERLIAVVLTGTGTDGTEGARLVKGAGGTVVIQDPETAAFGGMPGSLAPNTVDIVAPLDRIGPLLGDFVTGVEVAEGRPEAEERRALGRFLEELRERHGVSFRSYKTPTIVRRLKRRMAATGSPTIDDYRRYLEENPEEYRQVVNTFLIKVTEFFRDPELFEHLRTEVLPELIAEARDREDERRSAAASNRRLDAILQGMSEAVLAVDGEGTVLFSNDVFRRTFGDGRPGDPEALEKLGGTVPLNESGERFPPGETPQARANRGRFSRSGSSSGKARRGARSKPGAVP